MVAKFKGGYKMAAVIQFKRGTAARWAELNLVLLAGEPGFVTDENRFKVGDGITPWNDLPYMGESSVINANTHYDFPSIGKNNTIYKAESEKKIYQWNPNELKYEELYSETVLDINLINGGDANG
jgi:hypothetical protein